MELKYGRNKMQFSINPKRVSRILMPEEKPGIDNPVEYIENKLKNPTAVPDIKKLIQKNNPERVVIIVNDVSRPTPYQYMLPPLMKNLEEAEINKEQITFIIATGIHEPNSHSQNQEIFGKDMVEQYEFISHNPDANLVKIGQLSSGNNLYINQKVAEADFIITTGVILPHYFAGFSGGRKSILPGVAGRETIEFNHSRMVELLGSLPPVNENFLSLEMIEAAEKVGVDFILNVVTNSKKEIVEVVAGDVKKAWYQGIKSSGSMYQVNLEEKKEVAIVSAGGYPRDINLYQAQKA
ncbi:MAG: nickel-dependent lactate racemase, partial [Bacillota bacterium]